MTGLRWSEQSETVPGAVGTSAEYEGGPSAYLCVALRCESVVHILECSRQCVTLGANRRMPQSFVWRLLERNRARQGMDSGAGPVLRTAALCWG